MKVNFIIDGNATCTEKINCSTGILGSDWELRSERRLASCWTILHRHNGVNALFWWTICRLWDPFSLPFCAATFASGSHWFASTLTIPDGEDKVEQWTRTGCVMNKIMVSHEFFLLHTVFFLLILVFLVGEKGGDGGEVGRSGREGGGCRNFAICL